jgi:hypothetical protein
MCPAGSDREEGTTSVKAKGTFFWIDLTVPEVTSQSVVVLVVTEVF